MTFWLRTGYKSQWYQDLPTVILARKNGDLRLYNVEGHEWFSGHAKDVRRAFPMAVMDRITFRRFLKLTGFGGFLQLLRPLWAFPSTLLDKRLTKRYHEHRLTFPLRPLTIDRGFYADPRSNDKKDHSAGG